VTGVVGRLWYALEGILSYGYALAESLFFIAFSGVFIFLRSFLKNESDELNLTGMKPSGRKKSVKIFYGSQTGTAKVCWSQFHFPLKHNDKLIIHNNHISASISSVEIWPAIPQRFGQD